MATGARMIGRAAEPVNAGKPDCDDTLLAGAWRARPIDQAMLSTTPPSTRRAAPVVAEACSDTA